MKQAGIIGTGRALPEKILTNFDLEKMVDTSDEWIVSRTGIKERRVTDQETASSDLAAVAAKKALDKANLTPEALDMIIVATVTPDMSFPSTACLVQEKIGAINASAFDVEAACSGFLYGLNIGKQFIATGEAKNVLVIGVETLTKITDYTDRNTCVLFGDGAGAVILSEVEKGKGVLSVTTGADGRGSKYLTQPAGGSLRPASLETVKNHEHFIKMEGNEVFKFAVRIMGKAAVEAVKKAGYQLEDVNYLVPHQANIRIIEAAAKRLKLPMDKVKVNLDRYGNMSAASIPVALDEALEEGSINQGDKVVLVGFGGGLTWGASLIQF